MSRVRFVSPLTKPGLLNGQVVEGEGFQVHQAADRGAVGEGIGPTFSDTRLVNASNGARVVNLVEAEVQLPELGSGWLRAPQVV